MPSTVRTLRYDVFLSHERGDDEAATALAEQLVDLGFRVWLDLWDLVPGAPVRSSVVEAVVEARAFVVCIGARRMEWAELELQTALDARSDDRPDLRVVTVLLPGADPDSVPDQLAEFPVVDASAGLTDRVLRELEAALGREVAAEEPDAERDEGIDLVAALAEVDARLAADPDDTEARAGRVGLRMIANRPQEALEDVEILLADAPSDVGLLGQKFTLLAQLGRTAETKSVAAELKVHAEDVVADIRETFGEMTEEELGEHAELAINLSEGATRSGLSRLVAVARADRDRAVRLVQSEASAIEAAALLAEGDADAALTRLREAVALDPDNQGAYVALVQVMVLTGRADELGALTQELEGAAPGGSALVPLAVARHVAGDTTGALALLDRRIEHAPDDPLARAHRADLLATAGHLPEAIEDVRVVLDDNPSNWRALYRLIELCRAAGDRSCEADGYDTLAGSVDRALPWMVRSGLLPASMNGERLLEMLEADPKEIAGQYRVRAANLRSQAAWEDGRRADALASAFATVTRWPRQYPAWGGAAAMLEEEPHLFDPPADAGGEPWLVGAWRALAAVQTGDADAARATLEPLIAEAPQVGVLRWLRGVALSQAGDPEAALADFAAAAELNPTAPAPRTNRAGTLVDLGRLEDALVAYNEVVDDLMAADEPSILFQRGEVRRQLGMYQASVDDMGAALALIDRDPALRPVIVGTRGQAKLGLGDLEGAEADLDDALAEDPAMPWALESRAMVRLARGDVEGAIADRRALLKLLPDNPAAWELYALLLLEANRAETLWPELAAAIDEHGALASSGTVQELLGHAAIGTGRFQEAESAFGRAAALEPGVDFYLYEQSRAVRLQGRVEEADALVQAALDHLEAGPAQDEGQLQHHFNRALYLLALGRAGEAAPVYAAILADLDDPDVASVALRELDELEASGAGSPAARKARDELAEWLERREAEANV